MQILLVILVGLGVGTLATWILGRSTQSIATAALVGLGGTALAALITRAGTSRHAHASVAASVIGVLVVLVIAGVAISAFAKRD